MKKERRGFGLVALEWMDQAAATDMGVLRSGSESVSHGPRYASGKRQQRARVNLPEICYRVFGNARVSAASSSVVLDDKKVVVDRVREGDPTQYNYVTGHLVMHGQNRAIVRLGKPTSISRGIFLGGNGSSNYYHWLVEIVPKCEFLSSLPGRYNDFPLLVNEAVREIPSFREILAMFAADREVVYLDPSKSYRVGELVCIDAPNSLPFNLVDGLLGSAAHCRTSKASIDYLRGVALSKTVLGPSHDLPRKRILLGRRKGRRDYNQEEVEKVLMKYGFETVFMEEHSFAEQVRTINDAEWVIGPTGAAWTNLIFGRRGARALCWMAEDYGEFSAYSNIAEAVGADLQYLTYQVGSRSSAVLYQASYRVDVDEIDRFLKQSTAVEPATGTQVHAG